MKNMIFTSILKMSLLKTSKEMSHFRHSKNKRKQKVLSCLWRKLKNKQSVPKNKNYFKKIKEFNDEVFASHFRMNWSCFKKLLKEVEKHWTVSFKGRPSIVSAETALYVTLWGLCNENCFRELSDRFDIAKGLAYKLFYKMCKVLSCLAKKFIRWPTEIETPTIIKDFDELRNPKAFPSVVGCVDCTHIKISGPIEDSYSYYNRKNYYSMVLQSTETIKWVLDLENNQILFQGICDSRLIFRDVYFGWPGGAHDANIWRSSPIGKALDSGELKLQHNAHILGDSAYPLNHYLITPYRDNGFLTEREKKFNKIHSSTRVCVEQAFGMLKAKFRILNHLRLRKIANAKYVVIACVVVHNFIRLNSQNPCIRILDVISLYDSDTESSNEIVNEELLRGRTKRDLIAEFLF